MKKIFSSLPVKLLIGIVIGIIFGQIFPENVMSVVVSLKNILGQVINFVVPLIVIGFIAPSITKLGNNASRMLGVALMVAYTSSVLAALLSMGAGYAIIPNLPVVSEIEGLKELPEDVFGLTIPQIMNVMSALAFSILIGLAAIWTKAKTIITILDEFQNIVLAIVSKIIIPILPVFIAFTFTCLSYDGTITKQLPVFVSAVVIVMIGHYIWLTVLYVVAGVYSGKNPIEVVKHYGPAYITAVGTMSSAATLAVALRCARKSKVLREDMVRIRIDGSVFLYDRVQGIIWYITRYSDIGTVLRPACDFRHWSPWSSGRNGNGIIGTHYRSSWLWR